MSEKKYSFESSMQTLESIILRLEEGHLNLDDALKTFEEGAVLVKGCSKSLKEAELRIEKLMSDNDESIKE